MSRGRKFLTRSIVQGRLLAGVVLLAVTGCKGTSAPLESAEQAARVALLEVFPPAISLAIGDTLRLTATPKDSAGGVVSGVDVAWVSSDSLVVGVDRSGLVTAEDSGVANITATSWGASATVSALVADSALVPPPPPPLPPGGQTDEPVFDAANPDHVNLFYDDFSSYALGTATTLFDGSGAHEYDYRAGQFPDGYPEDPNRIIMAGNDLGGGREGGGIGSKYLRLDYTGPGPEAMYITGYPDLSLAGGPTAWQSVIITFNVRFVGTVYYSKLFEIQNASSRLWVLHFNREHDEAHAPGCWWYPNYPYWPLNPHETPTWWGPNMSNRGGHYFSSNMGGPRWYGPKDPNADTSADSVHPWEDRGYDQLHTVSSGEWMRFTIRYAREAAGSGTGMLEMWLTGTNPGGYGRILTSRKIMHFDGRAGNCEAGKVFTGVGATEDIIKFFEIGNTTSGNWWNEQAPYDQGTYIDFDAIRVWTIR